MPCEFHTFHKINGTFSLETKMKRKSLALISIQLYVVALCKNVQRNNMLEMVRGGNEQRISIIHSNVFLSLPRTIFFE